MHRELYELCSVGIRTMHGTMVRLYVPINRYLGTRYLVPRALEVPYLSTVGTSTGTRVQWYCTVVRPGYCTVDRSSGDPGASRFHHSPRGKVVETAS